MAEFSIVGIGSSAGGLEALQKLFTAMPADSGLAFVIAAHLDPTQKSHLSELLARCTKMPVVPIETSIKVEPDHVYVIAPDQELTIRQGIVHTNKPTAPRGHRHPVDSFFRSLAEDQGERAIAIVLSGTGSNGSQGLRFIKAEGGVVIVQEPTSAAFQGMPSNAIGTGIVDLVLPPEQMPEALLELARHSYLSGPAAPEIPGKAEAALDDLLALVRVETNQDFRGYRQRTLLRRIHRRMGLHRIEDLSRYIERLRVDPEEVAALTRDLTINVTGFFRDPGAWRALDEQVIRPLVEEGSQRTMLRIWVPGCSTGEEAYSIAMLVVERAEAARKNMDLRVFSTDVAQGVLMLARNGLYPASIEEDVGEQRLQRFFKREGDGYSIKPTLRDKVTFAPQNLLQDPPFSRLDLVSCRNFLIYLEPEMQRRVLALFHFSLREGGHLFLGTAETVHGQNELFSAVSKKWRIYRRLGPTRHDMVDFPLVGSGEHKLKAALGQARDTEPRAPAREVIDRELLERYVPASALIDRQYRIQYLRGPIDDYLRPATGEPSHNLLTMARQGLQKPLRDAIRKASDGAAEVTASARVRRNGALHPVRLVVTRPRFSRVADATLLVTFFGQDATQPTEIPLAAQDGDEGQLQVELETARQDLRLTLEQAEAANEELQASNEEVRSINEELQASNEELETSKEELQSLNEELKTVNNQLQAKVEELEARTDDLNNLLNSTDIATLFLDRELRIRWFTPAMQDLLALLPSDLGRPVAHFAQRFTGGELMNDARQVLETLSANDTEVVSDAGRCYLRRSLPYRTAADRIDGVVMSFTDITGRKQAEREVQAAGEFAQSIVDTVREPLVVLTHKLRVHSANESFYRTFQVTRGDTEGRLIYELGNQQWNIPELRRLLEEVLPQAKQLDDFMVEHAFETIGHRVMLLNARQIDSVQLILLALQDITERRRGETERELLTYELSHRVKNVFAVIQGLATQTNGRLVSIEQYREAFLGRLHALATAHSMLLDTPWQGVDLKDLVERVLAPYRAEGPNIVEIDGKSVALTTQQSLGLGLVLHELATNAAKYGALAHDNGRLHVWWREHGAHRRLHWPEHGGPPVAPPAETGFGSKLIETVCSHQLEGTVERNYTPAGLRLEMIFPVA
jgi:two-component system CheB/CheR fusion protein